MCVSWWHVSYSKAYTISHYCTETISVRKIENIIWRQRGMPVNLSLPKPTQNIITSGTQHSRVYMIPLYIDNIKFLVYCDHECSIFLD